jgi:hypothetical protein
MGTLTGLGAIGATGTLTGDMTWGDMGTGDMIPDGSGGTFIGDMAA